MKYTISLFAVVLSLTAFGDAPKTAPPTAADTATTFLDLLENAQTEEALKLWDEQAVNDTLKQRVEKMSAKIAKLGGIARVDVGTCEPRRIEAHEKRTGEKIDVVPVEIICGDENLLLAVFSVRKIGGQDKIFMLESLKEWGGTASLDEEIGYQH
jgi:hypothetical protein